MSASVDDSNRSSLVRLFRKHGRHALVLPLFAFLALGSAPSASGDKSSPAPSASASTQVTSGEVIIGSCLQKNRCVEDLAGGREEWQAEGGCTSLKDTWRSGIGCPTDRKYLGSCLVVETNPGATKPYAKYRTYEYLQDGETGNPDEERETCKVGGTWTPNPALVKTAPSATAATAVGAKPASKGAAKPSAPREPLKKK